MTEHSEIFNKAFENHKSGNFEVAQNLYMEILKNEPENAEVWDLLGVLNFQNNDFDENGYYRGKSYDEVTIKNLSM